MNAQSTNQLARPGVSVWNTHHRIPFVLLPHAWAAFFIKGERGQ